MKKRKVLNIKQLNKITEKKDINIIKNKKNKLYKKE